jgi:pimeloyl-ACP methyl ester carboxylesterase
MRAKLLIAVVAAPLVWAAGCSEESEAWFAPGRGASAAAGAPAGRRAGESGDRALGLVLILTGIQGNSPINEDIRRGLQGAGIQCAVEIRQWGLLLPIAKLAVNQINVPGNRAAARKIAEEIAAYQAQHPNRPVYLIGHSGGGGIAVFALEHLARMPGARPVTGAIMLSASISNDYDLTAALAMSREGIVNFYNEKDVALLGIGTTLLGNVDGGRKPSAGRVGFARPAGAGGRPAAYGKLHQVRITKDMVDDTSAPHVVATSRPFISAYVAEWLIDQGWPPPRRMVSAR